MTQTEWTAWQKWKTCGSKKSYKSKAKANKGARKSRLRLYRYVCPLCGNYHLTTQKQRNGVAE